MESLEPRNPSILEAAAKNREEERQRHMTLDGALALAIYGSSQPDAIISGPRAREALAVLAGALTANPCYLKAAMRGYAAATFVLLPVDRAAPSTIRHWAQLAQANGLPKERYTEALQKANLMEAWPDSKWPD